MPGIKHDNGKPRLDLVDPKWLTTVAMVLGFGAEKYSDHNWRGGLSWSRLYAATQRHLLAFHSGEINDPESGLPHIAHATCNLMMLLKLQEKPELNDLYWAETKQSGSGWEEFCRGFSDSKKNSGDGYDDN